MVMPRDIPIIDTHLDMPYGDYALKDNFKNLRDRESVEGVFRHPAGYMFKEVPKGRDAQSDDPVADTIAEMDRFNIEMAIFHIWNVDCDANSMKAIKQRRDRFRPVIQVDPNNGMDTIREIQRAHDDLGIVGVSIFPVSYVPPVPINDKRMYPIYAKCIELDIAVLVNSGIPGPRLPYEAQYTGLVDEVCWFFPELRFILRHGCDPWADLAVKLLLKWPNLYYSTSAFAPKYYPKEIIDFANTRGADKIIYAGYYPSGLTLDRIFKEMDDVPFRDHVWRKFLYENARTALKLD